MDGQEFLKSNPDRNSIFEDQMAKSCDERQSFRVQNSLRGSQNEQKALLHEILSKEYAKPSQSIAVGSMASTTSNYFSGGSTAYRKIPVS